MSRPAELYQWIDTVVMRFPTLSKPQATGGAMEFWHDPGALMQFKCRGRYVGAAVSLTSYPNNSIFCYFN